MAKKKGRKQQPKHATSKNTNDSAKIEIIEETDEGATSSSANSTPERENAILPQSEQSPFAESQNTLNEVVTGSIATPPNSQKAQDIEEGEIISSADSTPEKTGSKIAVGSAATSQQPTGDSQKPNDTEMEEGEIIEMDKEENSSPATSTLQQPNSDVAIGSVATDQQPITDTVQPSTINTDNADKLLNDTAPTNKNTDDPPKAKPNTISKDTDIQQKTSIDALPKLDGTPTYIRVANISSETTREDLITLFGFDRTSYLRDNVRLTLFFQTKGKFKGYAIIRMPTHVRNDIIQLDGLKFNNRLIHIKDIRLDSLTPHELRSMSQGSTSRSTSPISGRNNHTEDLRPTPNASSRQEESVSTVNGTDGEFEGTLPEKAGGGTNIAPYNQTMAQVLGDKEARTQMEAKRRRQLLINFHCDDEGAPYPSAHMVYWVLTEQLGLSKDPSNGVQAIYAPTPINQWRWCVLFDSEDLKSKFEGKTTTYTHNHNNTNYTYTFTTIKTTSKGSNRLMITVQKQSTNIRCGAGELS